MLIGVSIVPLNVLRRIISLVRHRSEHTRPAVAYEPSLDGSTQVWPPEDPNDAHAVDFDDEEEDDKIPFQLPDTPWTYPNGSVNPSLQPSNAFRRRATANTTHNPDSDEDDYDPNHNPCRRRVRRGSEGYEIAMTPADKEEILQRYIVTRGEDAGHYKRYTPEPSSPSLSSSPTDISH